MNLHILEGRLGADPKSTEKDGKVTRASFSVATETVKKDEATGKYVKGEPDWHNVVVFGGQAGFAARALQKGSHVLIEGRVKSRSYEGKDKVKSYITETIATNLKALGGLKPKVEGATEGAAPAAPATEPDPFE